MFAESHDAFELTACEASIDVTTMDCVKELNSNETSEVESDV